VPQSTSNANIEILLYDGATIVGWIAQVRTTAAAALHVPCYASYRVTPTNASHQYIIKAITSSGTATVNAGTGGSGTFVAGFIRITKA